MTKLAKAKKRLESVEKAIDMILVDGAQQVEVFDRKWTALDLKQLEAMEARLRSRVATLEGRKSKGLRFVGVQFR